MKNSTVVQQLIDLADELDARAKQRRPSPPVRHRGMLTGPAQDQGAADGYEGAAYSIRQLAKSVADNDPQQPDGLATPAGVLSELDQWISDPGVSDRLLVEIRCGYGEVLCNLVEHKTPDGPRYQEWEGGGDTCADALANGLQMWRESTTNESSS